MLCFATLSAQAIDGSWTEKSAGGRVSVGQQTLAGRPLRAAGPLLPAARVTRVAWRIELLAPPPPGLEIKLCAPSICFPLTDLSGVKQISRTIALSPDNSFRFVYSVNSRGPLSPALQVVSNQLTVNYQTR